MNTGYFETAHQWLPDLSRRIFDLRGKSYYGCGFSYEMEAELGAVIIWTNSPGAETTDTLVERAIGEVRIRMLFDRVAEAEWSVRNPGKNPRDPGNPWHKDESA